MRYCEYKILKSKSPVQELFFNFKEGPLPFLLESSLDVMGMGRYSFFGNDPFLVLSVQKGRCVISKEGKKEVMEGQPLSILRELLRTYNLEGNSKTSIPFLCGAVGFFSYDFGFSLESIKRKNVPDPVVPELMFAFYDCVTCVDHLKNEVTVFSSGFPEKGSLREKRAKLRLVSVLKKFKNLHEGRRDKVMPGAFLQRGDLSSNFSKDQYLTAIRKAKDYIAAGDIYQVNLSQMFKAHMSIEDWALYQRLLKNFPVAFSAFFSAGGTCLPARQGSALGGKGEGFSIISASPERFLYFDGRRVSTRPMKGTRRRTSDPKINQELKRELIQSKKEKAELLMIVDLERNDLGRVCDYGSIKVKCARMIEAYANVFQATAEIEGVLHRTKDRLDLIRACFPGGSVTGCPKIRAMEIIEELEPEARSIYTGSLGYLSFHNTLQLNILIRSFLKKADQIYFNVGGGIVADSKPAAEYEETLIKGRALMEALKRA